MSKCLENMKTVDIYQHTTHKSYVDTHLIVVIERVIIKYHIKSIYDIECYFFLKSIRAHQGTIITLVLGNR